MRDWRSRQSLVDIAAGRDRRPSSHSLTSAAKGFVELRVEISDRLFSLILDADQRCGKARDLELLRHHQRDGLAGKEDLLVVKRPERRAWRGSLVGVFLGLKSDIRPVVVREHLDHTGHCERGAPIDTLDAALRDLTRDDKAMSETGHI